MERRGFLPSFQGLGRDLIFVHFQKEQKDARYLKEEFLVQDKIIIKNLEF